MKKIKFIFFNKSIAVLLSIFFLLNFAIKAPNTSTVAAVDENIKLFGAGESFFYVHSPSFLASDRNRIVTIDQSMHHVAILSSDMNLLNTAGSMGYNNGEVEIFGHIAIYGGSIFAVDAANRRINEFNFRGEFIMHFSTLINNDPTLVPQSIAVFQDIIYVSMRNDSSIYSFNLQGSILQNEDSFFHNDDFQNPYLYADQNFIYSWCNTAMQLNIYNEELDVVHQMDLDNLLEENFIDPSYLISSNDDVLVFLDQANQHINLLNKNTFAQEHHWSIQNIHQPTGITCIGRHIFIASALDGTISKFNVQGKIESTLNRPPADEYFWVRPYKIESHDNNFIIFDKGTQTIKTLDQDGQMKSAWYIDEILPKGVKIHSFTSLPHLVFLLNKEKGMIYVINHKKEWIDSYGPVFGSNLMLANPLDLAVDDSFLYIADSGNARVVKYDFQTDHASTIISSSQNQGQLLYPYALDVDEQWIAVFDGQLHALQWYNKEGLWMGSAGKKGNEAGSFFAKTRPQFVAPGKIMLSDSGNHRIQVFDLITQDFTLFGNFGPIAHHPEYLATPLNRRFQLSKGSFFFPCSSSISSKGILVADTFNARIQVIPFSKFSSTEIKSFPPELEIIFDDEMQEFSQNILIWSETPMVISGKITPSDPQITIKPDNFTTIPQWITLEVDKSNLTSDNMEAFIDITINGQELFNIPIIIVSHNQANYRLLTPMVYATTTNGNVRIPFNIEPINGFEENVSFTLRGSPGNVIPSIDPSFIRTTENLQGHIVLNLNPNRRWEHGKHELTLEARSVRTGITKQNKIMLYLHHSDRSVPRRVLTELFSGIWCDKCIYFHHTFHELNQVIGNIDATFIQYYVFSTVDHPKPRMSFEKSDQRIRFYQFDQGLPSVYFDGVDSFKGTPLEDRDAEVYRIVKSGIERRKKDPALLSISGYSVHDALHDQGVLHLRLHVLDDLSDIQNPQLFVALVESNIDYRAPSGKSDHHLILRDFITFDPSDTPQLGIPLKSGSIGFEGKPNEEHFFEIPYSYEDFFYSENLHFVVFVQDQALKKVLQSIELPLDSSIVYDFQTTLRTHNYPLLIPGSNHQHEFNIYNPNFNNLKLNYQFASPFQTSSMNPIVIPPFSSKSIIIEEAIPENYPSGEAVPFSFNLYNILSERNQIIAGSYYIAHELDPDFELHLTLPDHASILSGEDLELNVSVNPSPYFNENVNLSLHGDVDLINEYEFSPISGLPPFNSRLLIQFKPDTYKQNARFFIRAHSGDVTHDASFNINVLKNPAHFPPELILYEPDQDILTNQRELVIIGKTEPKVEIHINENSYNVDEQGDFEVTYTLKEGLNEIIVIAENIAGRTTEIILIATLDTSIPQIQWVNLPEKTNLNQFILKGQTNPDNEVFFFDEPLKVDEEGYFEMLVYLIHGTNYLEFNVKNKAGTINHFEIEIQNIILIQLSIGKSSILINEETIAIPAPPYIKEGRTMVPIRVLSEAFGFQVSWIAATQEVTLELSGTTIKMTIGSNEVYVNNEVLVIDVAPEIIRSSTFVPIRVISEILGALVSWNAEEQLIMIEY